METSLHRELKQIYADDAACCEVRLDGYRIDAVRDGTLIEIQHGSLAALRRKLEDLLAARHRVLIVKPIIHRKLLIQLDERGGTETGRRYSPKRGGVLDVFQELVYLARVFPHPRLAVEVAVCDIEERRYPRATRRKRRRWGPTHRVDDQRLVAIHATYRLATKRDLLAFLPPSLPQKFHTGHLAEGLGVPRWIAQKMAYCLRHCGAMQPAGKQGNAVLYRVPRRRVA